MADLMEFADAYRRRKQAAEQPLIPWRPPTLSATPPPLPEFPGRPPITSTGRGEFSPVTAARKRISAPRFSGLGAALTGAATAAAAPVASVPGQEFRQSLVRGLMGASAAFNQERARQDNAEARGQALAARLAELGMKPKPLTAAEEADKARQIAEARLPSQLARIEAQNKAITGRLEGAKKMALATAGKDIDTRLYAQAWDDVIALEDKRRQAARDNLDFSYSMPDEATLSAAARAQYDRIKTQGKGKKEFSYIPPPTP